MLSSFSRHFNETVFRGPDMEGGSDGGTDIEADGDVGGSDAGGGDTDGGGDDSGESHEGQPLTVREQLKKAIAETSEPQPEKKKRDPKTGRFGDRQPKGQEAEPQEAEKPPAAVVEPPASLPKELKAAWDKAPPEIQQAFLKRETDMAKGVEELKNRYTLIDQAIAPHTDALRQMNATPGEAVNRMFLWFKALANSPAQAFPELAKSMGVDWTKLAPQQQAAPAAGQQPQGQQEAGAVPEIPEPVKNYVGTLEKQVKELTGVVQQIYGGFTGIQQNMNSQNEARTRENLSIWSKDKPYFDDVRMDMAQLIEKGIIPLKADGQVDLDTAYERAIYFNPTVRAKVLAEQQQANAQVQQQTKEAATTAQTAQVTKAKKAAVSLPVGGPGAQAPAAKKKPGEKLSVRDALKAAMAELRDQ